MAQKNAWMGSLGSLGGSLIGSMWGPIGNWAGGQIGGDVGNLAGNAFAGNWNGVSQNLVDQLQKGMDPMKALGMGGEEEKEPQAPSAASPFDVYELFRQRRLPGLFGMNDWRG